MSADLSIWSLVEPGIYLITACLPTLRPLLRKFVGKLREGQNVSLSGGRIDDFELQERQERRHSRWSNEESMLGIIVK